MVYDLSVYIFLITFYIIIYLVRSIAFFYILRRLKNQHAWLAWIPLARMSILGVTTKDENNKSYILDRLPVPNILLDLYWLIAIILAFIPIFGWVVALIVRILGSGTIYSEVYAKIEERKVIRMEFQGFLAGFINLIAVVKFYIYWWDHAHGNDYHIFTNDDF